MTLEEMIQEVANINTAKGWYDHERPFSSDIALLHSEVSEMYEAYRKNDTRDVHEEAADVLIRLLDTCGRYGIDLETEYSLKCAKNRERPYRHGGKVE